MTFQVVELVQGTTEWKAHRANHLNASDAPAMMACTLKKSRTELLREMASGIERDFSDYVRENVLNRGHAFEAYARPLAESIIGLFKTEVINFLGPWKSIGQVEWETLEWVSWYNNERLYSAIGYTTPQEAEEAFYENLSTHDKVA